MESELCYSFMGNREDLTRFYPIENIDNQAGPLGMKAGALSERMEEEDLWHGI